MGFCVTSMFGVFMTDKMFIVPLAWENEEKQGRKKRVLCGKTLRQIRRLL